MVLFGDGGSERVQVVKSLSLDRSAALAGASPAVTPRGDAVTPRSRRRSEPFLIGVAGGTASGAPLRCAGGARCCATLALA